VHFQVEPGAGVGVLGRNLLVQLDPQAGRGRRDDVAVLPLNRLLQDLAVEAAP